MHALTRSTHVAKFGKLHSSCRMPTCMVLKLNQGQRYRCPDAYVYQQLAIRHTRAAM